MLILMEEFDGEPTPTTANDALYDKLYATMSHRPRCSAQEKTAPVALRLVASSDGSLNGCAYGEAPARKSA